MSSLIHTHVDLFFKTFATVPSIFKGKKKEDEEEASSEQSKEKRPARRRDAKEKSNKTLRREKEKDKSLKPKSEDEVLESFPLNTTLAKKSEIKVPVVVYEAFSKIANLARRQP